MGIPVLNDLNEELTRLFAAGSRLAADDPRIKKFIPALQKLGEKAPVFLKMSELLDQLVKAEAGETPKRLIAAKGLLLAVLNTQGQTAVSCEIEDFPSGRDRLPGTDKTYKEIYPVISALANSGNHRIETIKEALASGIFSDPRTIKAAACALNDNNYELTGYLIKHVYPAMGGIVFDYIRQGFDMEEGKAPDARRLKAMHRLKGKEILPFAERCLEKGSETIRAEAINVMSGYIEYEDMLIDMLDERKAVKEAAINGLLKMESEKGIDLIIEMFANKGAKNAKDAIAKHSGRYLVAKTLELSKDAYNAIKPGEPKAAEVIRFHNALDTLRNKCDNAIAEFLCTVLSEADLGKYDDALTKEDKLTYGKLYDKALNILYGTGHGSNFIWGLFKKTQKSGLGKLFQKKDKNENASLSYYAFKIGIVKLSSEEFFDAFFPTGIFDDINKANRYLFEEIRHVANENDIAFSKRLAGYFADRCEFARAISVIYAEDRKTIKKLISHFYKNMENNTYSYDNYQILKFAGENKLADFKKMYETFCGKNHGTHRERAKLHQYLP